MNSKKGHQNDNQNYVIFFIVTHFLVWLIMCFLLGWWGIIFGFLANFVIDTGLLSIWVWQEKKHPRRRAIIQQREILSGISQIDFP
jgi:Flp pilus assembly protein TadB